MFTLHVLGQCRDQLNGLNIHLYRIFFSEASLILDKACLYKICRRWREVSCAVADVNFKTCPEFH